MNSVQIAILAAGLALNSFISFFNSGYSLTSTDFDQKLRSGATLFIFQVLMSGAGLWLGIRIGILAVNSNYYISQGILMFVGLKIIFDSLRYRQDNKRTNLLETRDLVVLALSEGILPLLLGIAIGLDVDSVMIAWLIIISFQTIAIIAGFSAGLKKISISYGFKLEILAGLVILAAALKMLISLIGY
ncbi:MAG: manganese efflux pump [Bacteroidetes bacterium]|nr:manganese efflux pump [Bacteroidota bacterium]